MEFLSKANSFMDLFGESFDLSTQLEKLSPAYILAALLSATLCGLVIYFVYRFFYKGIVYSTNFNILLLLITVVTAFIIMTISSNLVLSLGMVGALSIVRFRSAIKDPLDIGFLFWGISAGITSGAGLYFVSLIGTAFIAILYIVLTICKKEKKNYLLIVRYSDVAEMNVSATLHGMKYKLKNKTVTDNSTELTVEIKVKRNDTTAIASFKAIEGVSGVTLLEYNGEYLN